MIHLGPIVFLRPWWLVAIPILALMAYLTVRKAAAIGDWNRVIEPKLLAALAARGAVTGDAGRRRFAGVFAAGFTVLALAGPAMQRDEANTFRNLDAMVIAIDLSRSVIVGGHLAEARAAAAALAQAAGSRQVALIVYAGDAYLTIPFTTDSEALDTTIFALDGQTVPDPGTRPARALSLAHRMLKESGVVQGDVVLLSDGGGIDSSAFQEAKALASDGYALEPVFIPAKEAMPDTAPQPDRRVLQTLAASVNASGADILNLEPVLAMAANRPAIRLARSQYSVLAWKDFGRLLIVAALVPALLLFRRRADA